MSVEVLNCLCSLRIELRASQQEVDRLRVSQGSSSAPIAPVFTAPPSSSHAIASIPELREPSPVLVDLLTDSDGGSEMSMDLASPLQPTLTLLRGSEPVAPERTEPNLSESRSSRPSSPLLPHLTSTIACMQPSDPDLPSDGGTNQRLASPLIPIFTLRPTPPFHPPSTFAVGQVMDDTAELARVRDALESAHARLEAQDRELALLRSQLMRDARAMGDDAGPASQEV